MLAGGKVLRPESGRACNSATDGTGAM